MRKFLLIITIAAMVGATAAAQTSFTVDNIKYAVAEGAATAEVVGHQGDPTSVIIPDEVTFNGHTYAVTSIAPQAFDMCMSLLDVTIGNNVKVIGKEAFDWCFVMTSLKLGSAVETIGESAFVYCMALTTVDFGQSLQQIGELAFGQCEMLKEINLPATMDSIAPSAFYGCKAVESLALGNVRTIGDKAFWKCTSLTAADFGNELETIGREAFYNCGLTSLSLPESLKTIDKFAFEYNTALTEVVVPDGVSFLGEGCFGDCSALTSVSLGAGLKEIDLTAFNSCKAISKVTCIAIEPPLMSNDAFHSSVYASAPLRVPAESVEAYRASNSWGLFASVEPLTSTSIQSVVGHHTPDGVYYDLQGRSITNPSAGLLLHRLPNGKTIKELRK